MIESSVLPDVPAELSPIGLPLLAALDPHRLARSELLAAGVAPATACALYPLNQFDVAAVSAALVGNRRDSAAFESPVNFDNWLIITHAKANMLRDEMAQPWLNIWWSARTDLGEAMRLELEIAVEQQLLTRWQRAENGAITFFPPEMRAFMRLQSVRLVTTLWYAAAFVACSAGLSANAATRYFNEITAKLLATSGAE